MPRVLERIPKITSIIYSMGFIGINNLTPGGMMS
jgi:hypothetical protein